ncbi:MAG: hypothetical protein JOZ57_11870, partial [Abitibacteriaceae bacterium]|nr:hypothetical protein [Abditibacteriaceae bacterium]
VAETLDRVSVKIDAVTIAEFALVPNQTPSAKERAQKAAQQVNDLLKANLKMHEITVDGDDHNARLLARGVEIARVTPADAKLENTTPSLCAQKWRDGFKRIFWRENINGKL